MCVSACRCLPRSPRSCPSPPAAVGLSPLAPLVPSSPGTGGQASDESGAPRCGPPDPVRDAPPTVRRRGCDSGSGPQSSWRRSCQPLGFSCRLHYLGSQKKLRFSLGESGKRRANIFLQAARLSVPGLLRGAAPSWPRHPQTFPLARKSSGRGWASAPTWSLQDPQSRRREILLPLRIFYTVELRGFRHRWGRAGDTRCVQNSDVRSHVAKRSSEYHQRD